MRICLVHEEYPAETNFGGIATYQKRLAEEYVRQGHKVYVIARGLKKDQHYIENGVDVTRIYVPQTDDQIQNYVTYRERVSEHLLRLQNNNQIDIIEVPDWGAETVLFEQYRKVPIVVRLHTPLHVWLQFNKNNFGAVTQQMLEWEKYMLNVADQVTCCSRILKRIVVGEMGIKAKNILVTPNPADLTNFCLDSEIKKQNRILYVGSLEERKGVVVLAKALNIFFAKYPDVQIDFIGKDTNRNNLNISTIEYIRQIVEPRYHKNLNFLGQIDNEKLNQYYNRARVAVFPSLFDNFPYVVLEAMATGVQVVGSKNSGMVEMLADKCVYNTPDEKDLARLIIEKYAKSLTEPYNMDNIRRVKRWYQAKPVCRNMCRCYEKVISDYKNYNVPQEVLQAVCDAQNLGTIKDVERITRGVANAVFKVATDKDTFIVKKYNYNIDFALSEELISRYHIDRVHMVKPMNNEPISVQGYTFNIFPYIKGVLLKTSDVGSLVPLILTDRSTNKNGIVQSKCEFYYNELQNVFIPEDIKDDVQYTLNVFAKIKKSDILKETCLNHGDLSRTNILKNRDGLHIIDFDETTIGPFLYDFAVVGIKFCLDGGRFDECKYDSLKNAIVGKSKYSSDDCDIVVKFYLCKILLEKFYLHCIGKINLFSKNQMRDFYLQYLNVLKDNF